MQPDIFSNIFIFHIIVYFMVRFYGNTVPMDLPNVVHNGINRLGIYFIYFIMLIVGY